ncbi:MAG: hypothetical protein DI537_05970 [Stutzerimonas stutzeri]|nr:MAG: hypothetical protein DI537_05970 [Stutzerimonas stutzeri]
MTVSGRRVAIPGEDDRVGADQPIWIGFRLGGRKLTLRILLCRLARFHRRFLLGAEWIAVSITHDELLWFCVSAAPRGR